MFDETEITDVPPEHQPLQKEQMEEGAARRRSREQLGGIEITRIVDIRGVIAHSRRVVRRAGFGYCSAERLSRIVIFGNCGRNSEKPRIRRLGASIHIPGATSHCLSMQSSLGITQACPSGIFRSLNASL